MAAYDPEWRILRALAEKPLATPALRQKLRLKPPLSASLITARLGRMRAWGWLTSQRSTGMGLGPVVTTYAVTEQGQRALAVARQRRYAVAAMALEGELAGTG